MNSLFIGNVAPSGAGMRNNDPSPIITNSTFAYNEGGAAIRSRNGSKPVLTNSIVWANPGGSLSYTLDSVPVVTFSNIEGGFTVNGNIDDDPLFVNPAGPDGDPATLEDNDYRLPSSSPSVDTGIDLLTLPLTDLDGNPRIAGGTVDMGPYEFSDTCTDDADCDDGSLCTTGTCSGGACIHTPVCPDDGNACTLNSCDPATGACSNPPNSCDDGNVCTADSCDMLLGCSNTPLECDGQQTCVGGECVLPLCNDDGVCQAGEDCLSCPNDCAGKQNGSPANRFCCGDLTCQSAESSLTCAVDCGVPAVCGDSNCDFGEDPCSCPMDCGSPPLNELPNLTCSDGVDNDCDDAVDCQESVDCVLDPACEVCAGGQVGDPCLGDGECCSNKCRGPKDNKTCR